MVFVAVHVGAGFHSLKKRPKYLQICTRACEESNKALLNGSSAEEAVVVAIKCLEDDVFTNAGFGSNLNDAGNVECDACLMNGNDLLFGSVGAIQSIRNPIEVAHKVLVKQRSSLPFGLIPPNIIVGEGARKFAISNGCQSFDLKSDKALESYSKYKKLMECDEQNSKRKNDANSDLLPSIKHKRLDTVGAICIDNKGVVSSGVSSGGLILKKEGRVGQASIVGAGCWAQDFVSVSTSGVGEYIIRTSFAKECSHRVIENKSNVVESLIQAFNESLFGSPLMRNIPRDDHLVGVLGFVHEPESKTVELFWAHSTVSMCIGYMSSSSRSAKSFVSELDLSSKPGFTITAQSKIFKYD